MRAFTKLLYLTAFFFSSFSFSQSDDQLVLQTILQRYYKTEKPVFKGRSQLLYLYCLRANNNEEIFEAIQDRKLPNDFLNQIRSSVNNDFSEQNWAGELDVIYQTDQTNLKKKINECLTLEKYQEISKRLNLNNQRLMIISKPLYYSKSNIALVKVVFYRNIEHNNGAILLMEKVDGNWVIKEYLNQWST